MKNLNFGSVIGILGGGQLGKMSAIAAAHLGYKVHVFTDCSHSPASHVAWKTTVSDYSDLKTIEKFLSSVDVVTFEFENIPYKTIKFIEDRTPLRPSSKILCITQNRLKEKNFLNSIGVNTVDYAGVSDYNSLKEAYSKLGYTDYILKSSEMGYDGKGQFSITSETDLQKLWTNSNLKEAVLEAKVDFICEISVVVARDINGNIQAYPPVQNLHKNSILAETRAPAEISKRLIDKVNEISCNIVKNLSLVGVLAIEMFLLSEETIIVNELAPRPHNSGHWTMDACITGQFEQHIRAICGLPLGSPKNYCKAIMYNLLGSDIENLESYRKDPKAKIYIYGKDSVRPGRKMGHITKITS